MKKLTILYSRLTGYTAACQRALKNDHGVGLQVFHWTSPSETPFGQSILQHIDQIHDRKHLDAHSLAAAVSDFQPDAILVSGWVDRTYLRLCASMRKKGIPVIAGSDSQWRGTLRQQLGRLAAPILLHPAIDVLWVTGERQREMARRLGYRGQTCWEGYYACDWDRFSINGPRSYPGSGPFFLFAGRFVAAKGLNILVQAYRQYRAAVSDPWPLICVGAGKRGTVLEGVTGLENRGFVPPDELPKIMHQAGAFVLPSRWEPWGVAIQEAAAAGLPLICSDACGAAVHLLRDGYNGFLFTSEDAEELARALLRVHMLNVSTWEQMSQRSHELSKQYTPSLWASTLVNGVSSLRAHS